MRIEKGDPLCLFDTSGLISVTALSSPTGHALRARLTGFKKCVYHAISLAELAEHTHSRIAEQKLRKPIAHPDVRAYTSRRKQLIIALREQQKNAAATMYAGGPRFVPITPSLEMLGYLANQRQLAEHICRPDARLTVLAHMVDHQILSVASWAKRARAVVTFVTGDKHLISAAHRLGLGWIYSHDPSLTAPFRWTTT